MLVDELLQSADCNSYSRGCVAESRWPQGSRRVDTPHPLCGSSAVSVELMTARQRLWHRFDQSVDKAVPAGLMTAQQGLLPHAAFQLLHLCRHIAFAMGDRHRVSMLREGIWWLTTSMELTALCHYFRSDGRGTQISNTEVQKP